MKKALPIIKNYAALTIGAILNALAIDIFLAPNQLAYGGVSGIATALNHIMPIPIGVISIVINIPLFVLAIWQMGNKFGIKSIYATLVLSVFIDVFSFIKPVTFDLLLASLFGGVLSGIGLGIVFVNRSTTGGTDIIAVFIQKVFRHMSMGKILLIVDILIIAFAAIVFKNLQTGLYSVIALYASSYMIDSLIEGLDFAKLVFVISNTPNEIANAVNSELQRGATSLSGFGTYSKLPKNVIMCTVKRNEIPKLKDVVLSFDKSAFMIVADVREVLGEGFKNYQ